MFQERIQAALPALGVTRLGRLTGLDRIGIPVWMAVRPNAANLSVTQGKGLDDTAASLSAAMEAAEMAVAEMPRTDAVVLSPAEAATRCGLLDTRRYLLLRQAPPPVDHPMRWVRGLDLISGAFSLVPEEVVGLVDRPTDFFWQSSDGLGAGGSLTEAAVQALCELIERDAMGLWSFRSADAMAARECTPASFRDDDLSGLAERIAKAGLALRLFDITTDIGVPAFLATIAPSGLPACRMRFLDLASGSGAHPRAARAAARAVLEAVQTRLTTISGARDDMAPGAYAAPLPPHLAFFCESPRATAQDLSEGSFDPRSKGPALLSHLLDRMRAVGAGPVLLVSFATESLGFSSCRVLAPGLEQDPATKNRWLGRRALRMMAGAR